MKKILAMLITAALIGVTAAEQYETEQYETSTPAVAEQPASPEAKAPEEENAPYQTMFDLYQAWHGGADSGECPYPDYVCGVWTDTGGMDILTVATTKDEAGLAGQEEILALIADDGSVKFTFQSHAAWELWEVQAEISAQMGGSSPIFGCGIDETENVVSVSVLRDDPSAEETALALLEKYLDKVVVDFGDGFTLDCTTAGITDAAGSYDIGAVPTTGAEIGADYSSPLSSPLLWVTAAALLIAITAGAAMLVAKRRRALQTAEGGSVEEGALTARQTADLVRDNPPEPDGDIFGKITARLNDEK